MACWSTQKPFYHLSELKEKIKSGEVEITLRALEQADDDFRWGIEQIIKGLLKLNDKYHLADRNRNHFYKTEERNCYPYLKMDFYKAKNLLEGEDVYIHLYIRDNDGIVVVDSFHELD